MKEFVLRLKPGQDIKKELMNFVKEKNILAGVVLTCVGSLKKATLRLAGAKEIKTFYEKFEIVSFVGTLSKDGLHLHISLSDKNGKAIGGHMMENCIVNTTAEIVIGELGGKKFSRKFDERTGFKELVIKNSI